MAASMLFKALPIRHSFAHNLRKLSGKLACAKQLVGATPIFQLSHLH
jgi:hypothetical protein